MRIGLPAEASFAKDMTPPERLLDPLFDEIVLKPLFVVRPFEAEVRNFDEIHYTNFRLKTELRTLHTVSADIGQLTARTINQ